MNRKILSGELSVSPHNFEWQLDSRIHVFLSSFLNEIRGTVDYILLGTWGTGPQQVFTMGANIDGVPYSGNGPNKKDAKKACAKDILLKLYSIRA